MTPVTISANAITDAKVDQGHGTVNLANYSSYDLKVSISSTDHWAGQDARVELISAPGTLFAAQPGTGQYGNGDFKTSSSAPTRYLASDTAMMYPGPAGGFKALGSSSLKPGGADGTPTLPSNGFNTTTGVDPDTGDPTSFAPANDQRILDASWGDTGAASGPNNGLFSTLRITLPTAPAGYAWTDVAPASQSQIWAQVRGQVKELSDANYRGNYAFYLAAPIPEPTSIALMGLGLGAATLRRRKA